LSGDNRSLRNVALKCRKSTKIPDSKKASESFVPAYVGTVAVGTSLGVQVFASVGPTNGDDGDIGVKSGSGPLEDRVDTLKPSLDVALGQTGLSGDPTQLDQSGLGFPTPSPGGSFPVSHFSTLSEPEDVFQPLRTRDSKKSFNPKRIKSINKSQQVGVPKCLQLLVAVQEGGKRARRRRAKPDGALSMDDMNDCDHVPSLKEVASHDGVVTPSTTPSSGLALIASSGSSLVLETQAVEVDDDRVKYVEAVKLLEIHKQAGFSFEEEDGVIIKQLIEVENCDRAKKMSWEQRNVYQ
jgi:hypothetical protein